MSSTPAAAAASAASASVSATATFASISYGVLGQLVAHCLSLPDLAAWSSTNKDGARVVSDKFDHYRFLNLSGADNEMSVETFTAMTDRLRGVEVLLLPFEHEFFLALIDAEEDNPVMRWTLRGGINVLIPFIDANAAWMRIIAFDESQSPEQRPDGNCVSREQQSRMREFVDMLYQALPRWPHVEILPHTTMWIDQPDSETVLNHAVKAARAAAAAKPQEQQQPPAVAAGASTVVAATGAPQSVTPVVPSPLLFMAVMLDAAAVPLMVEAWPQLEMLHLVVQETPPPADDGQSRIDPIPCLQSLCSGFNNLLFLTLKLNCSFPAHSTLRLAHPLLLQLAISDSDKCPPLKDLDLDCPALISLSCIFPCEPAGEPITDPRFGAFVQYVPNGILSCLSRSPLLRALDLNMELLNTIPDLTDTIPEPVKVEMDRRAAHCGLDSLFLAPRSPGRIFIYALSTLPCAATIECLGESPLTVWLEELLLFFPRLRSTGATHAAGMNLPPWVRPHARDDPISFEHVRHLRTQHKIREWDRMALSTRGGTGSSAEAFSKRLSAPRPRDQLSPAFITLGTDDLHQFTERRVLRMLQSPGGMFQSLRIVCLSPPTLFDAAAIRALVVQCAHLESLSITQLEGVGDALFMDGEWPAGFTAKQMHTLRLKSRCDDGSPVAAAAASSEPQGSEQAAEEDPAVSRRNHFFSNAVLPSLARLFPNLHHLSLLISQRAPMAENQHHELSALLFPPVPWSLPDDATPEQRAIQQAKPAAWPHLRSLAVNLDSACASSLAMLRWAWSNRLVLEARAAGSPLPPKCGSWLPTLHGVSVDFHAVLRNRFNILWCLHGRQLHHKHVEAGVLIVLAGVESACIGRECALESHQTLAEGGAAAPGQAQEQAEGGEEEGEEEDDGVAAYEAEQHQHAPPEEDQEEEHEPEPAPAH